MTTAEAAENLRKAKGPENIFAPFTLGKDEASLKKGKRHVQAIFRLYAKKIHPDHYKGKDADALFDKLSTLKDAALRIVTGDKESVFRENGILSKPVSFKGGRAIYTLVRKIASGTGCDIFEGMAHSKEPLQVIARVPKNAADSDLMERETAAYKAFTTELKRIAAPNEEGKKAATRFAWTIPHYLETVKLKGAWAGTKTVNLFSLLPKFTTGWHSLKDIHRQYPAGLDVRQAAFIFNRGLECLTFAHHCGIVHGAVTPNHVLIHCATHTGNIIDWTNSATRGQALAYMDPAYIDFYPRECHQTKTANRQSDVYMLAVCMVYLLGGDVKELRIPHIPEPIFRVLNLCLQPAAYNRPCAQVAHIQFQQALASVFGPPKFVELAMP